jgi:hypothetical protein
LYVARNQWSQPDPGDPLPCFRQGDLVRLTWATVKLDPPNEKVKGFKVELRTENVVLLSADCDLVDRTPPKRKGLLVSPLRPVPSHIARDEQKLATLKSPTIQPESALNIPVNLFYFEPVEIPGIGLEGNGVIHLEVMGHATFSDLKGGTKLAELTEEKRQDLRERIKFHFARVEGIGRR